MADSKASIVITAVDNTKVAINSVKSGINSLTTAATTVSGVLGGLGLALGTGAIISAIKSTADYADEMGKAAQKVGTTTEALSGLKYAGDLADVSFEQLQVGLGKLAKSAEDFRDGSKSAVDAFTKIGIDPSKYKDTSELFSVIADRLSKMEDGARKTAIAQELLGKSGAQLIPLLNSGADGLKAATEEAKRFGIIVTNEAAKAAEKFNDNFTKLSILAKGASIQLSGPLVDSLGKTTEAMLKSINEGNKLFALLQGFVGLGKLPFDFFFTSEIDISSKSKVKELEQDVIDLEQSIANLKKSGGGKLNELISGGSIQELETQLNITKNQLEAWKKFGAKIDKKTDPKKSSETNGSTPDPTNKKTIENPYAKEYAQDVATLMQAFQQLETPAQSATEKLQDQLDSYTSLEPTVKTYLQSLVDQAKASEVLAASMELNNSVMEITQQYNDAAAAQSQAISDAYNAILSENQDLNTALIKDDQERAKAQLEIEHNRRIERIASMQAEQDDIDLLLEAENDRFAAAQRVLAAETTRSKGYMKDLGATFSSAFEDAIAGGKKFSDVLAGLSNDIERMLVRRTITDPLMKGLDSMVIDPLSNIFSDFFANANGGVYSGAGISAYSGKLVSRPTVFPFANGIGLMGEAGPEAILPLRRGADGKLGVSGGGNNVTVNVFEAPGTKTNVQQEQGADGQLNIKVVVQQLYGMMGRDISRGIGLAPVIERRYGLNRVSGGA